MADVDGDGDDEILTYTIRNNYPLYLGGVTLGDFATRKGTVTLNGTQAAAE